MEPTTNVTPAEDTVIENARTGQDQSARTARAQRFQTFTVAEFIAKYGIEDEWLIPDFLEKGSITCFQGKGNSAKSAIAKLVAYCLAAALAFPGVAGASQTAQKVLYIAQDGASKQAAKLMGKLAAGHNIPYPTNLHIYNTTKERVNLSIVADSSELRTWIEEEGFDVVIVDALSAVHSSDENAAVMNVPMAWLIQVAERATVVLIHHAPKGDRGDGSSVRGHTVIYDRLDNVWHADMATPNPGSMHGALTLTLTKSRTYIPIGTKLLYNLDWDKTWMRFSKNTVAESDANLGSSGVPPPGRGELDAVVDALVHLRSGIITSDILQELRPNFPSTNDEANRKAIERSLSRLKKAQRVEQYCARGPWYPFNGGFKPNTNGAQS